MAKILIGSSGRMIPLMDKTAEWLRSHKHESLRWTKIFEHGDITIDRLLDVARDVDGAILVFSGDDKVETKGSTGHQTRGNVLIEFGLFLGQLGRRKAIVLNYGENQKPSDLGGLTYLDAGGIADDLSPDARERLRVWARDLDHGDGITNVFSSFPLAEFRQALRQAKCLHILQTFIPYAQHLYHFEDDLLEAIKRDCEVQVLLSSPESTVVGLRERALRPAYGSVKQQISDNLKLFAALARKLPADKCDRLKVRVHTTMPSMSIYRVDDVFFSGHYLQGNLAIDSPQLRVRNPQSSMGKQLSSEHSQIWRSAAEVDLYNI